MAPPISLKSLIDCLENSSPTSVELDVHTCSLTIAHLQYFASHTDFVLVGIKTGNNQISDMHFQITLTSDHVADFG